jgi:hypothetical protein
MLNQLDLHFCKEPLNFLRGVYWSVIPIEHRFPRHQVRPFQAESFQEVLQDFDDIVSVDSGTPGNIVHLDNTIVIKEGENHLFHAACSDLCLYLAWCALF